MKAYLEISLEESLSRQELAQLRERAELEGRPMAEVIATAIRQMLAERKRVPQGPAPTTEAA